MLFMTQDTYDAIADGFWFAREDGEDSHAPSFDRAVEYVASALLCADSHFDRDRFFVRSGMS
jgi:hypothetical protein